MSPRSELTTDWMQDAACLYVDPEIFHPVDRQGSRTNWATARSVCATCPVTAQCLQFAIDTEDSWAMLGGLTPDERRPLMPRKPSMRAPITHGTETGARQHSRRGERACTACARAANIARRIRQDRAERGAA